MVIIFITNSVYCLGFMLNFKINILVHVTMLRFNVMNQNLFLM